MKRHGIFGGWFTLGGVRGRLSYLFSSIFSYLFFTVLIYLLFLFGFQAFLGVALTGSQLPTEYIRYFHLCAIVF